MWTLIFVLKLLILTYAICQDFEDDVENIIIGKLRGRKSISLNKFNNNFDYPDKYNKDLFYRKTEDIRQDRMWPYKKYFTKIDAKKDRDQMERDLVHFLNTG